MQYIKEITHELKADVVVIGGGTAGFGAAVAAARNGASTLLLERGGVLGGMATAGLVGPFMTCYDDDCTEQIVKGIFDELCLRAEEKGGAVHPSKVEGMTPYCSYYIASHCHVTPFLSETLALVMDEMAAEAGVQTLFNVQAVDCIVKDNAIDCVIAAMKEGLTVIRAKTYIDCTGDADVAAMAGVPFVMGDGKTGETQPCSLFFEVNGMDRDAFVGALEANKDKLANPGENCWSWYVKEARQKGEWTIGRNEIGNYEQPVPGRFKINTTRMEGVNACDTKEVSKALAEGRRQVQQVLAFMRKYCPGCENLELVQVAQTLGVRESRHIEGLYTLTADDIMAQKHFDDAICTFAYAIDIHNSEGGGVTFKTVNHYYTIPYRCLVPQKISNLLVAGRCISGTSEAAASYRVIPACVATGQAAGTAAALALRSGTVPANVDVVALRNTLLEQGAVIKN